MDASSCLSAGIHGEFRVSAAPAEKPSFSATPQRNFSWGFTFRHPLKSLWPVGKTRYEPAMALDHAVLTKEKPETKACEEQTTTNGNWVYKILHVRSLWKEEEKRNGGLEDEARAKSEHDDEIRVKANNEYDVCAIDDEDEKIEFNRESFSKLLRKVPLAEARLYAQISYLGTLAYSIPQIKPGNLLRYHGFRFVTSSLEKKEHSLKLEKENVPAEENSVCCDNVDMINHEMASLMAEEIKQGVEDDLNSTRSSPCEWFICDDDQSSTRFFVVQGSESMASWQANLLFEPIQFEGLDVLVHRGIYEAAKRIYEQFLPEIHAHIKSHGDQAKLRFTGHSLGGSLSVLVNLMLLIRGEVPRSSLLPVITYGAPSTMCGGDRLLNNLGLPRNHVRSITMHRDIVPRAFSCNYPNHVAGFLKAVNGNFRNHPCLNKQKLLFAPMGEFLILQPDDTFSPNHDLLPSGSGLYILTCPASDLAKAEKQIRAAQTVFLNCPHPLEILSDRSAYGSEGTIQRDHDMASYLKSVRSSIRQELNRIRKAKSENRRNLWWPLVSTKGVIGISVSRSVNNMGRGQCNFAGFVQTSRKSLKRFSTLVASQHMHLLVVLLFPARLLELGTCSLISIC